MRTLLALTLALCCVTASAATVYVNNKIGDDKNDGRSAKTAFATIKKAVDACGTSDTLVLANTGTPYRESIQLIGKGGTPAKPFVIEGNGATITGFEPVAVDAWEKLPDGKWLLRTKPIEIFDNFARRTRPIRQFLCEKKIKLAKDAAAWTDDGMVIATDPANRDFALTVRESGLEIVNASYIVCRNLIAEGFHNDGFNIHGECDAIRCENIVARFNGDDGFSIHEDITAVVVGGYFHHNDNGIQDVNASRSSYYGVFVAANRLHGVHFRGGQRLLVDAIIFQNGGEEVLVEGGNAKHVGFEKDTAATTCQATLRNVQAVSEHDAIVRVGRRGRLIASNCLIGGGEVSLVVQKGATCHVTHSALLNGAQCEVAIEAADVLLDHNLYYPGRFLFEGKAYDAKTWGQWQKDTGLDADSLIALPETDDNLLILNGLDPKDDRTRIGLTKPLQKLVDGSAAEE